LVVGWEWCRSKFFDVGGDEVFAALKQKIFGGNGTSTKMARSRLHFVLVQDRAGLTNDEMAGFKRELMEVIERYFVVQHHEVDIDYKREGETTTLLINSPVVVRRKEPVERQAKLKHVKRRKRKKSLRAPSQCDVLASND
jgi:cell division topological specificity factor MinE